MSDNLTLRELLTPSCPLGTADRLILEWALNDTVYRVKEVDAGYYLDIVPTLVNYRLVTTPIENQAGWARGWCYVGTGQAAWTATVLAAVMWDGGDWTEPLGWNKSLQTGEWRELRGGQTWESSHAVAAHVDMMKAHGWPEK